MCIIITKDKYVNMPSKNTLRRCWESNPQGAGYMVTDPSTRMVIGRKGFMHLDNFLKELNDPSLDKMNVIIHFRIATHGGVNAQATHPFPLSKKTSELNALEWTNRCGIAHNGIIPNYGTIRGLSDTQEFVKKVASEAGEHIMHPGVLAVLNSMIGGSRLAIMRRDKIVRLGGGWVQFKGCWFSNSGYKKQVYAPVANKSNWNGGWAKGSWWNAKDKVWVNGSKDYVRDLGLFPTFAEKEADPVVPEPTGYRSNGVNRPAWCSNACASCSYLEGGLCVMDEDDMYLKEAQECRIEC